MPMPTPTLTPWTDFASPLSGQLISAEAFGQPAYKGIHWLREQTVLPVFLHATSGDVVPGDLVGLVTVGSPGDWVVSKVFTTGFVGTIGVMIDAGLHTDGLQHAAQFSGVVTVNVDMDVVAGDWLRSGATAGMVTKASGGDSGICMRALAANSTPGGGQVKAWLYPTLAVGGGGVGGGGGGGASGPTLTAPPVVASWTQFNAASGITFTDQGNGVHLHATASGWKGIQEAVPGSGDWQRVAKCSLPMNPQDAQTAGIYLTDGTEVEVFGVQRFNNIIGYWQLTGVNSAPGALTQRSIYSMADLWLRIRYDTVPGRKRFEFSLDGGQYWDELHNELISTNPATHVGFGCSTWGGGQALDTTLMSWHTSAPTWNY